MSHNPNHSIIILSNQLLYADSLTMLLSENEQYQVLGNYSIKTAGIHKIIAESKPDLLLLDANGMGKDIWDFLHHIHLENPSTYIIMLANSNEEIYQSHAQKNGASGFVLKSSPKEILMGSIKIVLGGDMYFDPGSKNGSHGMQDISKKFGLGARELEVINLIRNGLSTKEIASSLGLSFHTVETHRKNIYNKLGIQKVTELIKIMSEFQTYNS